jgi:hemerythrin
MQSRFDAGENVTQELHGMLSRWLFNHIRNEDHGYVDSVHAYQRMLVNQRNADMAHMKEEVLRELKAERSKRSWWARLFGG